MSKEEMARKARLERDLYAAFAKFQSTRAEVRPEIQMRLMALEEQLEEELLLPARVELAEEIEKSSELGVRKMQQILSATSWPKWLEYRDAAGAVTRPSAAEIAAKKAAEAVEQAEEEVIAAEGADFEAEFPRIERETRMPLVFVVTNRKRDQVLVNGQTPLVKKESYPTIEGVSHQSSGWTTLSLQPSGVLPNELFEMYSVRLDQWERGDIEVKTLTLGDKDAERYEKTFGSEFGGIE